MSEHFDVVVVGGGTAGAAAAHRLSEEIDRRVLVLEAGPDFADEITNPPAFLTGGNSLGHNFAGIGAPTPDTDWDYWSEPLADGRRVHHRRAKMVGGNSMVNGTIAVRAAPLDFDRWQEHGASGWGWSDVKPYIERVETMTPIRQVAKEHWSPVAQMFVESFDEIGYRWVDDMNAPESWDGIYGQWPLNRKNAVRQGTLVTYVREARERANFTIRGYCLTDRLLIEDGRVRGVRYVDRSGSAQEVSADTVLLAAGAYGSPCVLLRSGIGPQDELTKLGIEASVNLPVGRNMMEHPQCFFYAKGAPELADMTLPGWPVAARAEGNGWWCFPLALDEDSGLCAYSFALSEDTGEGTITLTSSDPDAAPRIDHRLQEVINSDRFEHAHETYCALRETRSVTGRGAHDPEKGRPLREILQERMGTAFHPAGGCQIGRVVDEELRVHGVEGLRVADASVFPVHILNNPNLTCMMLGERVADMIKASA
ncbi:MAG: GMC family oxidoreductase [Gaiellaceae bacterium]